MFVNSNIIGSLTAWGIQMHTLCALYTLFFQILLSVPTAVLSQSGFRNESFTSLRDATNSSKGSPHSSSLSSPISLTFDVFRSQIPSPAVNTAFNGAITRIQPLLRRFPNDPITDNNFQYRAVGGRVQIGVTGAPQHRLSWQQLDSVLRQVASFMNGDLGTRRPHMQELSFEMKKDGVKIGDGLVSYRPPRGLQSASSTLANLTSSNDTRLLLAATDPSVHAVTANVIPFRIPDSPFILNFVFLGDAIPITNVWAAFEGAHVEILGPLTRHAASPIPDDVFEYTLDGILITVVANKGIIITWKQLSWVLGGMYGFMTGTPEHYQRLMCDVVFVGHGSVGSAAVGYHRPSLEVTKRALLNATSSLPPALTLSVPIPFPVPETPIVISFKYVGASIPVPVLDDVIWAVLNEVGPSYNEHGPEPIPGNHFFRGLKGVRLQIFANVPHLLSWIQLYNILWGLMLYVTGPEGEYDHHRVLSFDVKDVRTGKIAYGTLKYSAPKTELSRGKQSS